MTVAVDTIFCARSCFRVFVFVTNRSINILMKRGCVYIHCLLADLCGKRRKNSSTLAHALTGNDASLCICGKPRTFTLPVPILCFFFSRKNVEESNHACKLTVTRNYANLNRPRDV